MTYKGQLIYGRKAPSPPAVTAKTASPYPTATDIPAGIGKYCGGFSWRALWHETVSNHHFGVAYFFAPKLKAGSLILKHIQGADMPKQTLVFESAVQLSLKNGNMHKARIATAICPRSTICLFGMADREFNEIYSHFGSTKPPKKRSSRMLQKQIHLFLLLRRRADAKGVQIWPKSKDFIEFF